MPAMTDPTDALVSFQEYLDLGELKPQPGALDPDLQVLRDTPAPGVDRMTYVYIDKGVVTALAMIVTVEPFEGRPCFMIGYAVPPAHRGQGRAKAIVTAALAEIRNGFGRAGILPLYIEAVVGEANHASRKVAEATLSTSPDAMVDELSGQPALHYLLKVDA